MGFMSGFLQGAEGMNNLMKSWSQMNAANAVQDAQTSQNASDQAAQASTPTAIPTGNANSDGSISNLDGGTAAPAPGAVTATPLAPPPGAPNPAALPDPISAMKPKASTADKGTSGKDDKDSKDKTDTIKNAAFQQALSGIGAGAQSSQDQATVNPAMALTGAPAPAPAPVPAPVPATSAASTAPVVPGAPTAQVMAPAPTQGGLVAGAPPGVVPEPNQQPAAVNDLPDTGPADAAAAAGGTEPLPQRQALNTSAPAGGGSDTSPPVFSKILSALNPVSSASAEEIPPGAAKPAAATPPGDKPDNTYRDPVTGEPTPPPTPAATAPTAGARAAVNQPVSSDKQATTVPVAKGVPTVVTNAPSAAVAPDQAGPTAQSADAAKDPIVVPPLNPKPYASLFMDGVDPKYAQMVQRAANDTGVSPERLAVHWNAESRMATGPVPNGTSGEIGPLQIMPATRDMVDPKHQYDPSTIDGALHIAGLYINRLDGKLGQDTPASVLGYNAGEGNGAKYANKQDGVPSSAVTYAKNCFANPEGVGPANCYPPPTVDPAKLVETMKTKGPEGTLQMVAATGAPNVALGVKWQAAETALVHASLMRGDIQGAQESQELILQMSRQGASNALMNADKAMVAGDSQGAAQQLAIAHAFFPDGTYGKFGVDGKNQIWAQQFSEKDPTMPIGQPFVVDRKGLQAQLITTSDPNKYLASIQQVQQQNAQREYETAHGTYFASLIKTKQDSIAERAQAAQEAAATRQQALQLGQQNTNARIAEAKYQTDARTAEAQSQQQVALATRGTEADKAAQKNEAQYDQEAETFFGPGAGQPTAKSAGDPTVAAMNSQQRSNAALAYRYIRGSHQVGGDPMPSPTAYEAAVGIANNSMALVRKPDGSGIVVRKDAQGNPQNVPVAYLPASAVARLYGAPKAPVPVRSNPAIPNRGALQTNYVPPATSQANYPAAIG